MEKQFHVLKYFKRSLKAFKERNNDISSSSKISFEYDFKAIYIIIQPI